MLNAYGEKLKPSDAKLKALIKKYQSEFQGVKDLVTPSNKPVHEMTLEEFQRVMNI